jgi:hypothetical protein
MNTKNKKTDKNINVLILASKQKKGEIKDGEFNLIYREQKACLISELKPNKIYDIGSSILNEQYANETARWERYEKPVITSDGIVLKHWEDVLAAKANGLEVIDVIVVEGLDEGDLMRYINFCIYFSKLNYLQRFILISELEKYLTTTAKGKAWSQSLRGAERNFDINSQLGIITGYHKESIKYYKRIGKHGIKYFDETKTLEQMYYDAVMSESKKASVKENMPAPKPDFKLGELKLNIGGTPFSFNDTDATFKKNMVTYTQKIGKVTVTLTIKNPDQL